MRQILRVGVVGIFLLTTHGLATAQKISRVDAILEKAAKDILAESEKLTKKGQQKEADDAEQIVEWLVEVKPGLVDQERGAILFRDLVGHWTRPGFADSYMFNADGTAKALGPNGASPTNEGKIRSVGNSALLTWNSGHMWQIYRVDKNRLAVEEKLGGSFVNDGIVLTRR
jgi:hypothetical protein